MSETSPKLRAELEGIPTYKPGKPAAAGGPVAYKLSSNENPYPPLPGVMETVAAAASSFNRYPDTFPETVRTLIMIGDNDFTLPEHAVSMKRKIPGADLAIIPHATHMDIIRKGETIVPMIEANAARAA